MTDRERPRRPRKPGVSASFWRGLPLALLIAIAIYAVTGAGLAWFVTR